MDSRTPIIRSDDGELLGYVGRESSAFTAQTVFGHVIARTERLDEAEMVVRSEGLLILKGIWRYYDEGDKDWFPCIIKEVFENRVIVIRTNESGYQDAENYKHVTIKNPDDTNLLKA